MSVPGAEPASELPDVDEHLVARGCGYEVDDGVLVRLAPPEGPRSIACARTLAVLEAHVVPALEVVYRQRIRTSRISDLVPDVCVVPRASDPRTGGRQLAVLALELVAGDALARAARKADQLVARGVARVFALELGQPGAFEWSPPRHGWVALDPDDYLEHPALAAALPVAALLRADHAAVARALRTGRGGTPEPARPGAPGRVDVLLAILAARGLAPTPAERARILAEPDPGKLLDWIRRVPRCASLDELLGAGS